VSPSLPICLVIAITDGDILRALCDGNQQERVRLADIDAPERRVAAGRTSEIR
jgi:endonuclease YncB( thermonuclease family)